MNNKVDKTNARQGTGGKVSALTLGITLAALLASGILGLIVISV